MAEIRLPYSIRDERGLGLEAVLQRLGDIDPDIIKTMDIANIVSGALQPIAYGFDMLGPLWDKLPNVAAKRAYILDMYHLQGRRGTPWSVETAMGHLGWPGSKVLEWQQALYHNGFITERDGYYSRNTCPMEWYEWWLKIPLCGKGYSADDHADVLEVGQYYGPLRARLTKVILDLGELSSSGGGAPSWSGPTALDHIGVSEDGITWTTHKIRRATVDGSTAIIEWTIFEDEANTMDIEYIGLILADGSEYAHLAYPLIHKTSDIELSGSWSISW